MSATSFVNSLYANFPADLVNQALETYSEVKRNFYLGHLRPNEVEGGRFAEAVFRMLEYRTTGTNTPVGRTLSTLTMSH